MVRIAVVGCGTLGIKIAGALAHDGHEVRVHDSNSTVLNKVYLRLNEDRRVLKEDGFLDNANFVGDVYCFSNLEEAVRGAQFVFECAPEEIDIKRNIFKQLDNICGSDVVIASSSIRLSINDLIEGLSSPERCLGIRFLYPVYYIPEVELLPSDSTSLEVLAKVRQFLERMGRVAFFRSGNEPIVLNDEQRDARKSAYVHLVNEKKGLGKRLNQPIPNLGGLATNDSVDQERDQSSSHEKECVVCMDKTRDCVLHPCHHLCTCIQCGRLLLKRQDACPICRRAITNAFRVYHA